MRLRHSTQDHARSVLWHTQVALLQYFDLGDRLPLLLTFMLGRAVHERQVSAAEESKQVTYRRKYALAYFKLSKPKLA